jgi:DNA ligase-1
VQAGVFTNPAGAKLWSAITAESAAGVWRENGSFLAYPKPDGWRLQAHKIGGEVQLYTRGRKEWSGEFPEVVRLLSSRLLFDQAVLDLELMGFDGRGRHLDASRIRRAASYQCVILDALQLGDEKLTTFPARERLSMIQNRLAQSLRDEFSLAEYQQIESEDEWRSFYGACLARRTDGFDGAIVKLPDDPYFRTVLKVKPEEPIDAVVVGAYRGKKDERTLMSLLLAVPDRSRNIWVPIGRVNRNSADWDAIWKACEPYISSRRPDGLVSPPEEPDVWIAPAVVVSAMIRWVSSSPIYSSGVKLEAVRECTIREDKAAAQATPFEKVLQLAGPGREESQLSLFDA